MNKATKSIPTFANEAQERAYWESHDSVDHLDWSKAKKATMPNLKPTTKTISLRLPQHLLDAIKIAANARDVPASRYGSSNAPTRGRQYSAAAIRVARERLKRRAVPKGRRERPGRCAPLENRTA